MVKSKYKILQLFVVAIMLCMIIGGLFGIANSKSYETKRIFGLSILVVFIPYMIYLFFKRAPRFSLDENFIEIQYPFNKFQYSWSQVLDVDFHTKADYTILFIARSLEAMTLTFDDGRTEFVWNDMYRNVAELRRSVAEQTENKFQVIPAIRSKAPEASFCHKKYAGNALLTFNSLTIIGIVSVFPFLSASNNAGLYAALTMGAFLFVFFGTQMYFFQIIANKLIIRNHYFFWIKKEIYLSEIEEAAVETPYKRSTSLRIITKDFCSIRYGAGSLRSRHWKELGEDLDSFGIVVRFDDLV